MGHTGPSLPIKPRMAQHPKFGLLASIPVEKNVAAEWTNGIRYLPEGCVTGRIHNPCEPGNFDDDFDPIEGTGPDVVEWLPYGLSIEDPCVSTMGESAEERAARVRRLMEMDTERQLALEFWEGNLASASTYGNPDGPNEPWPNTWLSNDATMETLGAGATDPVTALACLDAYLGRNNGGQQGAVHAPIEVFDVWVAGNVLKREGDTGAYLTPTGHLVIASPGYSGVSPDGIKASGNIWSYATDMPRVFLSDIDVPPQAAATQRSRNRYQPVATRFGLVEWERCRHAGIQVDVDVCDTGS